MIDGSKISTLVIFILWTIFPAPAQPSPANQPANALEIQTITVDGKPVPLPSGGNANLGSFPQNIVFGFGVGPDPGRSPTRIRYKLEGYENTWHESDCEMSVAVRFFDEGGDQMYQEIFNVKGESAGWTGSLKTSPLTHRRETLTVPPRASRLWVSISSAGPPAAVGIYVVADLLVSKSSGNSPPVVLIRSPFDHQSPDNLAEDPPPGWVRDGIHASMARIIRFGQDPATKAFAILDDDPISHAEWRTLKEAAPAVTPGDHIVIEWNEMYSMGVGNFRFIQYPNLPPGNFRLRVMGVDPMGIPTGTEASLAFLVPHPFWKRPWFWGTILVLVTAGLIGGTRYWGWRKMRHEMLRLKNQQVLEHERLRIAHDIHDDLGARVTQISLVSAMAHNNPAFPEKARADFDRISKMSRELVSALYGTVWAVNPENDNLDALGNYLCQMVNQLCEHTQFRCRFHVSELPREVHVSSQTRHNISMAVKEAVHNVIKHAKASEVAIHMAFKDDLLTISVRDDGCGFLVADTFTGSGLNNMKSRLDDIGGSCSLESGPGGTVVHLRLAIKAPMEAS
jgi:signal transduction histidine kinase